MIQPPHSGPTSSGGWSNPSSPKRATPSGKGHRQSASESVLPDVDVYCPSIMVSLLHALSLLQNAILSHRLAHFQPSTACMISCVRSILATTGCLSRDAVLLRRHPMLAQERKKILSGLASLVSQAKTASVENADEGQQVFEAKALMVLGGRVFARVRRFLMIAVQCGVELPEGDEDERSTTGPSSVTESRRNPSRESLDDDGNTSNDDDDDTYRRKTPVIARTTNGVVHRPVFSRFQMTNDQTTPRAALRTKSMGDLRNNKPTPKASSPSSPPRNPLRSPQQHMSPTPLRPAPPPPTHQRGPSLSSVSSFSSISSVESVKTPATPKFPNGPCTVAEVFETLRNTHDQYISTIAAFIGYAHSHSRTSHASSTGHMLELVREVVEMVCRLLTIVDGVTKHPGIPAPKLLNLKASKHGLYNVTSSLAESVRVLTGGANGEEGSEEDESAGLLKSATEALKAGSDCANEVKKCLTLSVVDKPIFLQLPVPGKLTQDVPGVSKRPELLNPDSHSVTKLTLQINEDATVHGDPLPLMSPQQSFVDPEVALADDEAIPPPEIPLDGRDSACSIRSAHRRKASPSPLIFASGPVDPALPSPVSFARTDDDGTTWEGSHNLHGRPSQDTTRSGRTTPRYAKDEFDTRLLSHDYSLEDVAYNKDGVLVGASIECLVEKMTPHDNIVEPAFSAVFFMTFRMFSAPQELVASVIKRYNLLPPAGLSDEDLYVWQQRKGVPVRLRIANFLKLWLETYWRSGTDDAVLGTLMAFTRDALAVMFPNPSQRVMELIILRSQQTNSIISPRADRSKDAGMPLNPPSIGPSSDIPRPIMTKTLLTQLRARGFGIISPLDFDALELARQLTIMESKLYSAITAEEILEAGKEAPRGMATPNPNVKAVTSLSTAITGWVAETILDETDAKKRTALVKFFIKLSDVCFSTVSSCPPPLIFCSQRCNTLSNFSTSRAVLAALDSSTISRLQQTWTGLHQKYKLQLEGLRKLADHARNYSEYRSRLRNTSPPAVPFLGKQPRSHRAEIA